jgi:ketosteroid isomerase-like protein
MKKIRITGRILLLLTGTLLIVQCKTKPASPDQHPSFEQTLQVHLDAIQHANLTALAPTVADSVLVILPNGARVDSKQAFMQFHEDWFKSKNWQWVPQILQKETADSLGYALIKYKYEEKDSTGAVQYQSNAYLVLLFKNSPQGWQLVHDQNTKIVDSTRQ